MYRPMGTVLIMQACFERTDEQIYRPAIESNAPTEWVAVVLPALD